MRSPLILTLLVGTGLTLTGNLALAQSTTAQDASAASAQRITIKQKSSNIKGATDPGNPKKAEARENGACDRPYVWSTTLQKCVIPIRYREIMKATGGPVPDARIVPPKGPGNGDELPPHPEPGPIGIPSDGPRPPHPKDPLPPGPRPRPIPGEQPAPHHLPRDPGIGNGELPANPGGNPVEPALPCPPGFAVVHLKNGQTTCAKAAPAPMPPTSTAKQAAAGDHVQICPPYCGSNGQQTAKEGADRPTRPVLINRPQIPAPIEERRPSAGGVEPGGIMGPAGSPVPSKLMKGKLKGETEDETTGRKAVSLCPVGFHWVGPDPRGNKQGHCEPDKIPTD